MARVFNFCAGPAALPESVLSQAQQDLLNWQGSGMSVMEMSHRSAEIKQIAAEAERDLRELLGVSDEYAVLFLQGGASLQFSAVPLNLMAETESADYVNTGQWSKKAIAEARRLGNVRVVASSETTNFTTVPELETWDLDPEARYLHYTPNETIGGVEFGWIPECGNVPVVADMSSTILSRPLDVSRFGMIYAGAQKNIGPSGLTLVIVRRDLLGQARGSIPVMLDWKVQADNASMYNTPPSFSLYLAGLVFKWLQDIGGLGEIEKINRRKAAKLYAYIDGSGFYANPVEVQSRSLMNVPFTLADADLEKAFAAGARERGLVNLEGHRSVGGMRASIYNAVGEEAVDALIAYMKDFAAEKG